MAMNKAQMKALGYGGSVGKFMHATMSRQEALNKTVDKKYDKLNAAKGLTPKGKRKWHYYNSKIK